MEHARLAGDDDRVADLLARNARTFYAEGRNETVSEWFTWLERSGVLQRHRELAVIGALARALGGDYGGAERLSLFAFDDPNGRPREESDLGPLSLMVRSYLAPRGVDQALKDADAAYDVLRHDGEWAHVALGALAMATVATDGLVAAETLWADAQWRGESIGGRPLASVARGMRAAAAIRQGDWDAASGDIDDTIAEIEENGLSTDITSCLAFVGAARIAVHVGDLDKGRSLVATAAAIKPRLTAAFPVYSVLVLHEEARAYVELGDIAGARQVLRAASDMLALRPRLGTLVDEHEDLKKRLASLPAGKVGPSSLTGAELRLLPYLVTHLTYPEIGERLYVSKHTVKTQAMSIYRKLSVSSRSDAVEKARAIGLIST